MELINLRLVFEYDRKNKIDLQGDIYRQNCYRILIFTQFFVLYLYPLAIAYIDRAIIV